MESGDKGSSLTLDQLLACQEDVPSAQMSNGHLHKIRSMDIMQIEVNKPKTIRLHLCI